MYIKNYVMDLEILRKVFISIIGEIIIITFELNISTQLNFKSAQINNNNNNNYYYY